MIPESFAKRNFEKKWKLERNFKRKTLKRNFKNKKKLKIELKGEEEFEGGKFVNEDKVKKI